MSGCVAFVRTPAPSLGACELTHLDRSAISVQEARQQHRDYCSALTRAGAIVVDVPELDDAPDGVFVEDMAVILGSTAILTRPAAGPRRLELASVATTLGNYMDVHPLPDGSLDGGDVLRIGKTFFVGLSTRTDRAGAEAFAHVAEKAGFATRLVAVKGCLHLKTGVTALGAPDAPASVLLNPDWIDPAPFADYPLIEVAPGEAFAANTLSIGDTVIAAASAQRTNDRLSEAGFAVDVVEIGELQKAEAGLTCMSIVARA